MVRYGSGTNYWEFIDNEYHLERGRQAVKLSTTSVPIHVAPSLSAIVIVDMQNFFLSEMLGRGPQGRALIPALISAIASMRAAGSSVIWLNWGLDQDLEGVPPGVLRSFARPDRLYSGFGSQLPHDLGPLLIKKSWSTEVPEPLSDQFRTIDRVGTDILVEKSRISGFWSTRLESVLRSRGIETLFFAGVNTDQWWDNRRS